ncbi:probable inactive leucine-rich repeat receptor-like protein kinase At3g03770 [Camellia sinensis]|uniref:probable inactive leucine-rich repeat receptor-like protein kinase At3g03770 n=1 Tax=Camellia sinensis TaxID=4442 RepID=UPI0010365DA8|nr:probable inactive leucine-rich repeat receptor-like protein kinase At3g03770 [Camellia sinensis]XP_028075261.1 probable inactive leucine-rich repeat receptor-like protein kinase At3g03770 [Camellia sinensis]XP_028075262.1 probable inactive leucine-rich repeat receptor-like protein kinase At3g03770 [Camellia sinensis]
MGHLYWFGVVFLAWVFFVSSTHQQQTSQTQVLLQIRKQLEYPSALVNWENYTGDFCNLSSTPHMSITCQDISITELKIMGDKLAKVSEFNGFAIPNQTLSQTFSIDSFVTTLTRLTSLRVLSLLSLGIWGPLPDKIHRLSSLELLDMSSNFMFGSIPPQLARLVNLQSLTLDSNFLNDTVPNWLDSLSNLTMLSLKNNQLKGPFPSSICRIKTLTDIAISHNRLSGKLPDLSTLTSLHLLDLRDNHLDSELPLMPKSLATVLLSNNSFSGKICEQFGQLNQLQHLDLSFNTLSGTPPSSLFSLPNISYLNLASNILTGELPNHLNCGGELGFVDISANRLIGSLPSCLGTTSNDRVVKFGGNCLSVDIQHQHPESYCKKAYMEMKNSEGKEIWVLIGVIGGAIIVTVLLVLGLLILYRRYHSRGTLGQHTMPKVIVHETTPGGISSELLANARFISQAAKLGTQGAPLYRSFTLEELEEATDKFEKSTFLGKGSLGKIYKGRLENGTYVTIRSLALFRKDSIRNLKLRLDLLSKLRHPHLVGLLGHCIDGGGQDDSTVDRVFLVYEYVPNGDFRSHLSESCPEKVLTWSDRLAVLIGIAKAVDFLHTGVIPVSFSNRLKTNNILLDEYRIAKLSDYGMSIITEDFEKLEGEGDGQKSWHMTRLENDVYKFGFILLESLLGPIVTGKGEAFLLNEMASFGSQDGRRRIVDPIVLTTSTQESLSIVISITNKCISPESSTRPSFEDVLWNLQYAAQVQATADADQKSDAASSQS